MDPTSIAAGNSLSQWAANNGLAVVLLLILLLAIWRAASWCAGAFLMPMRDGALKHLETVGTTLRSVQDSLHSMDEKLTATHDAAHSTREQMLGMHSRFDRIESQGCGEKRGS